MTDNQFKALIGFTDLTKDQLLAALVQADSESGGWPSSLDLSLATSAAAVTLGQARTIVRLAQFQASGWLEKANVIMLEGAAQAQARIDAVLAAINAGSSTVDAIATATGLNQTQVRNIVRYLQNSNQIQSGYRTV